MNLSNIIRNNEPNVYLILFILKFIILRILDTPLTIFNL